MSTTQLRDLLECLGKFGSIVARYPHTRHFPVIDLAAQLGVLLWFWWRWRPWWRAGVGVRVSFWHFIVGVFGIPFPPVFHLRVSLHHQVHEVKEFVKFSLKGDHPDFMFIGFTYFSIHLIACTDKTYK
uniref:Uncharacterized protein n=1 Tax=Fagus sylvatica TaxID=28930 RepID=A0A2N9FH08_FAGSY